MIQVRMLSSQDAARFQRLRLEALLDSPAAFSSSYEEERDNDTESVARRISPDDRRAVFGAFDGDELVGFMGFRRGGERKREHKADIWGVYVTPRYRQRGVGRQLIGRVIAHAAASPGIRYVNLGVNAANAQAIALYKAAGFRPYGVEQAFLVVDGVEQDEIHMTYAMPGA
jgi:ribosomal protein S18 acetylase RimI-like enzyme